MTKEMFIHDEQRNDYVAERMRELFWLGIGDSELGSDFCLPAQLATSSEGHCSNPTVLENQSTDIR